MLSSNLQQRLSKQHQHSYHLQQSHKFPTVWGVNMPTNTVAQRTKNTHYGTTKKATGAALCKFATAQIFFKRCSSAYWWEGKHKTTPHQRKTLETHF